MKLLIVSCVDDNFGDNLIRICFEKLLRTVLRNLGVDLATVELAKMPHKAIDREQICSSDLVIFAGGGMFGINYMNNYAFMDEIIRIADEHSVPVVLSSIGVNNMGVTPENEHLLSEMLSRKCFRAVSVRENPELFRRYSEGCGYEIVQVCDPAVWSRYVYDSHLRKISRPQGKRVVGINVVRGGLFADNDKPWKLGDEIAYMKEMKHLLEEQGIEYVFYTNGSFLDNNSLLYFARENDIPPEKIRIPNSTRELVETIYGFSSVAAIRMHSSIISYALDVPSVDLVWNDKIPFFYQNIGYPERAIPFDQWNAASVVRMLEEIESDSGYCADRRYMMTLYHFLYELMDSFIPKVTQREPEYDFERVKQELIDDPVTLDEDRDELLIKGQKGEKHYLSRFIEMKKKDKEFRQLKKDCEKKDKEIARLNRELDKLNRLFVVRIYKKLRALKRKLISRKK